MLYRSSVGAPYQSLRREIDRLFEDTLGRGDGSRGWVPAVDVRENEHELTLEFELPGIRADNVEVTFENGVLTVRGEKREERTEGDEQGRYHLVERNYGEFTRSFQLPPGIDESEISADFDNGVLSVHIPKSALPQPRKIEVAQRDRQSVGIGIGGKERERQVERVADSDGGRRDESDEPSAGGRRPKSRGHKTGGERAAQSRR